MKRARRLRSTQLKACSAAVPPSLKLRRTAEALAEAGQVAGGRNRCGHESCSSPPSCWRPRRPSNPIRREARSSSGSKPRSATSISPSTSARAPITAGNFLKYVDGGFYDGGRVHRATRADNYTPNLPNRPLLEIIQADINPARGAERFPAIPLERTSVTGLTHVVGTVSMPRGDQADSARSGFVDSPERSALAEPRWQAIRRWPGHGGVRPGGRRPGCRARHSAAARPGPEPRSSDRDQKGVPDPFTGWRRSRSALLIRALPIQCAR